MDNDIRRKILAGGRIKALRTQLGLSQVAMAHELGVSVSYLNLMERNQRPVTAQILIKLSETYAINPKSFAQEEELRLTTELEEIFADPVFQSVMISRNEIRDLAETSPAVSEAVKRLHKAYAQLLERQMSSHEAHSDAGRGDNNHLGETDDPVEKVRSFLQQVNNHFPPLETKADEITENFRGPLANLFTDICDRLDQLHQVKVQVMPISVMGKTLRRFDLHRRKVFISELVEPSGRIFQAAYHLGLLEAATEIDTLLGQLKPASEATLRLARVSLGNYFAAALMMPYAKFLAAAEELAYDVELLGARFNASFEQVAHRLTTLSRPSARGVPFFMVRVDNAGNVSKRFSSGTFPFARFGGTCPKWNIHSTFHNPGQIQTQIIELPDGQKWFSVARTVRRFATPWGEPDAQFVVGLGCELKHAGRLTYARGFDLKEVQATPIGVNCRLCKRTNCIQRAAPPLSRPLEVNENIRGYSPFDADLSR